MLVRFIKHSSHYALGSLLVTLASLISFPIFTRTFSVAEYGALNLISSVLLLGTGIGKLGIQHSIVRFHAEVSAGSRGISESQYVSTVLIGMACTGIFASIGLAIAAYFIPAKWWHDDSVARLIFPLSALIVLRVLDSGISNILRAQQRSVAYNIYSVLRKYFILFTILAVMFYAISGLNGFYLGTVLAETLIIIFMMGYLLKKHHASTGKFSPDTFRAMLTFGIPMIAYEISGIILNLGDRYVIQARMGTEALGHYSAAYNLCEYLQTVVMASLAQAVTPIYLRMWEQSGEIITRRFVERALHFYIIIGAAMLAGVTAVGQDVLVLFASEKYLAGASIIPYVVAGMLVSGAIPIFGAGIFIHKQNHLMIPCIAFAAVLNIILNILMIPYLGLVAAGLATLICFIVVAGFAWNIGGKHFKFRFPIWDLCKFFLLASIMYFSVMQISISSSLMRLTLKIFAGVIIYGALVILFDSEIRAQSGLVVKRFLKRSVK